MAAITHTNKVNDYYAVNADATLKLLGLCKLRGVKKVCFYKYQGNIKRRRCLQRIKIASRTACSRKRVELGDYTPGRGLWLFRKNRCGYDFKKYTINFPLCQLLEWRV